MNTKPTQKEVSQAYQEYAEAFDRHDPRTPELLSKAAELKRQAMASDNPSEAKARAMVEARTTSQLIEDWEELETHTMSEATPFVRGWIMDELEKRDPDAFDQWIDSCAVEGPRRFFVA